MNMDAVPVLMATSLGYATRLAWGPYLDTKESLRPFNDEEHCDEIFASCP
jgi:hypothetical protein